MVGQLEGTNAKSRVFIVHSMRGQTDWYFSSGHHFPGNWTIESNSVALESEGIELRPWLRALFYFQLYRRPASFPIWVLVSLFAALAVLPRTNHRFSVRALLIATALVAVVLGIVAVAGRMHARN